MHVLRNITHLIYRFYDLVRRLFVLDLAFLVFQVEYGPPLRVVQ